MEQLFMLPEIDAEETKKKVEKALEACLVFEQIGYHPGIEPKTTPGYSQSPGTQTNAFHSSTEDSAQKNIDIEQFRREHVRRVRRAVSRLGKREREIIEKRYLDDPDLTDYIIFNEIHLAERTYYRVKARAFYKLAFSLKIEVLKPNPDQNIEN